MTVSRASALAAALAVALPLSAFAQGGAPLRLTPPPLADPQPFGAPADRPAAAPGVTPPPGGASPATPAAPASPQAVREEGSLAPLDFDSIGLLDERDGGLPATLWTGARRGDVDKLLREGPAPAASPSLRTLLRRVLLAPGAPPNAAGATDLPPFLGLRAHRLLRLGDAEQAARLARAGGRREDDPTGERVQRDAGFLAGDADGACALVREIVTRAGGPDWANALIACQALAGDIARAQLGLDMHREAKQPEDPWLGRLLAALGGDSRALAQPPAAPLSPYALPLLAAARLSPPAPAAANADPATLAAIVRLASTAPELRLATAERAAALGTLPPEALAEFYDQATLTPRDIAEAFAFAERERGPRGRAAMFRHLAAQTTDATRAESVRRGMRVAQARGVQPLFAATIAPAALQITPTAELAGAAPDIARVLLAAGHAEEAAAWHDALRAGAGPALDAAALIGPLLWLGGIDDDSLISIEALAEWRLAQQGADKSRVGARATLLASLLDALGQPAQTLLPSIALPAADGDEALALAAREGRIGEVALRANAALGADGLAKAAPARIAGVVRALADAGLVTEAHALALEAALAAGI